MTVSSAFFALLVAACVAGVIYLTVIRPRRDAASKEWKAFLAKKRDGVK